MRNILFFRRGQGRNWRYALCTVAVLIVSQQARAVEFQQKLQLQIRADDRSSRDIRYQYRGRYYPSLTFSKAFSAHAYVATGDEFDSAHTTLDNDATDYVYVRRAYLRHKGSYGKTEVGVIPTFKGRVSSSGLSKDGWIQGIRHVRNVRPGARLEVVAGQLGTSDPGTALRAPKNVDYLELEYTADLNDATRIEASVARTTGSNLVGMEVRHTFNGRLTGFAEAAYRLDNSAEHLVLGATTQFELFGATRDLIAFYTYVSDDFGRRAELTEHFLGTGNAIRVELSSRFYNSHWRWFARYEANQSRGRYMAGIKWSL